MKNKSIIFGSIFAVCILLLIPNVSAIEYKTVENKNVKQRNNLIENMQTTLNQLINKFENAQINANLLLTILIKGIILPIISLIISNGIALFVIDLLPVLAVIISFLSGIIVSEFFLIPIMNLIIYETGSILLGFIIYYMLAIIDIKVAGNISRILFYN